MADPRFFDNRGPFALADIASRTGADIGGADGSAMVADVAALDSAGPQHLTFCMGKGFEKAFAQSGAGFCLIPNNFAPAAIPAGMVVLKSAAVQQAFVTAAKMFYADSDLPVWDQKEAIHPSAKIGAGVSLAPGVVIGPNAEIGEGTRIGPNAVIGRGVTIGRDCQIGSNVSISHGFVGDAVIVHPGSQLGQPGYGFASSAAGHNKIPQLGRIILQDKVEIGSNCSIDRGALGDTVIGEGTKLDNLVHIAHNNHLGRHCMILGQVGMSGSCEFGDFVVVGGQVGFADHVTIGAGARFVGGTGVMPGYWPGGQDYAGYPARTMKEWVRETAMLKIMTKRRGKKSDV
ncbi:MAG TPA: UDP-3-O-(3-hydroxymyristoyl)glucosamine N-acyltransferase [Rhizomicrobium sp.]|jgi:UDP-3-O-[3-hydroxymyristoyl] glucosamine N-acyltransferase